jgi:hypothetical protein
VSSYQTSKLNKKTRYCDPIPGKHKRVSLLQGVQIGPGAHPASYSMGIGSPSPGLSGWDVKMTSLTFMNVEVRNIWSYYMPSWLAVGQTDLSQYSLRLSHINTYFQNEYIYIIII